MKKVADIAGGQAGAGADFLVGEVFGEFEADEFAAAGVEGLKGQADQANAFHADELLVGQGHGVGRIGGGGAGGVEGEDFAGLAALVEGEVVDGAVEPPSRVADLVELCLQTHKRFLNKVFRRTKRAGQAQGITQQGRFQSREQTLRSFRIRALHWLGLVALKPCRLIRRSRGDHRPARRPPVRWVDTMFTLYDTAGHTFLDEICKYFLIIPCNGM